MNQGMNQGISEVQSVCMRPLLGQGLYLCQGNFWQIYFFLRPDTTDDGPGPPPVWTRYECVYGGLIARVVFAEPVTLCR